MGSISTATAEPQVCLPLLDRTNRAHRAEQPLTVTEAAKKFGISVAQMYRYVADGTVPAWRNERNLMRLLPTPTRLALKSYQES